MKPGVLVALRMRVGAWLTLRTALLTIAMVGGAALTLVLCDAALDLPEQARVLAPWLLAGCAIVVLSWGAWQWRRLGDRRMALLFEQAEPSLGNQLINAVQLSTQTGSTSVGEFLRLEAVELGRKAAARVDVWGTVRQSVQIATGIAGAILVAWVCLVVTSGSLLEAVSPRFFDPHGDHPPYSPIQITVMPGKAQVLYGGQVEVRAKVGVSGAGVDKLWLVARSGTNVLRAIMFLAPDKTFFQTLANLREPTEYFVTDGRARSHRFPIEIRYTPQITLVEVTTTFPQYTGKPTRTSKLSPEPQSLPEDTRIAVRVVSNRPLKSGELSLTPVLGGEVKRLRLEPEAQPNVAGGAFNLTEPVVVSISVRDVADLDSAEPRQGRFNLSPDERPRLFALEPGRDAVATPSIRVPVRVEATDDYGITRVVWLRGLNRSIERPFAMKLALKSGAQAVEASGAFDFGKLGVRPGDVIDYYFEAADNYPKGPNIALSRIYRLQIISTEQYEMILRQAAARKALFEPYFRLDAWLRRLAERARNLEKQAQDGSGEGGQAAEKEAAALAADLEKYEKELGKLLGEATLFDVEQAFRTSLVVQHTQFQEARKRFGEAVGKGAIDRKKLAEAVEDLSRLAKAEEEDVDSPARQIAAVAHLLARADTFVKLARQQATLVQMLKRFSDRSGAFSRTEQMELQDLASRQGSIQEALKALLESLPELVAKLPEEPQYAPLREDVTKFIEAVAEAAIDADLSGSVKHLSALDGKAGFPLAQAAAEKMDRLISKCNSLQGEGKLCLRFKPSVQQALGSTLEQILAAMGARSGSGDGGQDGYGLFNDEVALYGPSVELAGEQAGGRGEKSEAGGARRTERVSGQSRDPAMNRATAPGRVHLQTDGRFPLRYRDLVGEYFRVIAESEAQNGGGK